MSANVEFTPEQQRQWKIWTEAKDRGYIDEDIAKKMHRTTRTITRLKNKAKANGAYQEWVESTLDWAQEEFRELHLLIKATTPNQAYSQMGRIIERSLTQRIEQRTEIEGELKETISIDWNGLSQDERTAIIEGARVIIKNRSEERSETIH